MFHHFPGMDGLYKAVMRTQFDRHWGGLSAVPSDLPHATRIERTVRARSRLFEGIGPVRRTGKALAQSQPAVGVRLAQSRTLLRDWMAATFSPEIHAARGRKDGTLLNARTPSPRSTRGTGSAAVRGYPELQPGV